jgi:hypothetical protein
MLKITIPAIEHYDESTNTFTMSKEQSLQLEHSLVSISKWESKWNKPFLSKITKTTEETIDYIRCMTIGTSSDAINYNLIPTDIIDTIQKYIEANMTATTFSKNNIINREVVTAEIIYYWMIALTIPFECQKWHLNKLLALINVCNIKNNPPKKMGKKGLMSRNHELNTARKQSLNTQG